MDKSNQDIFLDLQYKNIATVNIKQYDTEIRTITAYISDGGNKYTLTSTMSAIIKISKPNDTYIINNGVIDTKNGVVSMTVSRQMVDCYGNLEAELTLYEKDNVITTMNFYIYVEKSVIQSEAYEDIPEFKTLNDMIADVWELESTVTENENERIANENTRKQNEQTRQSNEDRRKVNEEMRKKSEAERAVNEVERIAAEHERQDVFNSLEQSINEGIDKLDVTNETAKKYAIEAKSYVHGGTGTRENEDIDNGEYYYNQIKSISETFAGVFFPMGTVAFAQLPDLANVNIGDMYNISDDFTTTSLFKEGAGHTFPAGTNIYKTADGFWDCLAGAAVVGVKGSEESNYRKGYVNLSPANIGALATNGDSKNNTVTFTEAATRANINSGESHSTILGKIKKVISDLKAVAFSGAYSDLTGAPTSLKNPQALTFTGGVTGSYDGSSAKTVAIPTTLPANGGTAENVSGTVAIANGGTGATTTAAARSNLGLGGAATQAVANNLTTTAYGSVLDARQGKILSDNMALLNAEYKSTGSKNVTIAKAYTDYTVASATISTAGVYLIYAWVRGGVNNRYTISTLKVGSNAISRQTIPPINGIYENSATLFAIHSMSANDVVSVTIQTNYLDSADTHVAYANLDYIKLR